MGKKIDGITVAINGDTSGLASSLQDVTSKSVQLSRNLKTVNNLLKLDPGNVELVAQKQRLLAESIETTREKLAALEAAQEGVRRQFENGEIDTESYLEFQRELIRTRERLENLQEQADEAGDDVDDLGDQAEDAGRSMERAGEGAKVLGKALKTGLVAAAKAAATAVAAAGAAAFVLAKDVVDKFGELEQNLGGSEAVFGEFAGKIQKTGEDAYKNLGMSQSAYLAAANKMGALLQGVGFEVEASLTLTEKAMQRAADMASVMGIDVSAAMEAVVGAAKGNFTMMDNLGVAINDTTLKIYAEEAGLGELETTQDKVNAAMQMFLELTEKYDGNFANESTQTLAGSLGLLASAWESLVAGLGNGEADIINLSQNVVDALDAALSNIEPVVENIVRSLPEVITVAVTTANEMLPELVTLAVSLIREVLGTVMSLLPTVLSAAASLFSELLDTLVSMLPELITFAVDALETVSSALIANAPMLLQAAVTMLLTLAQSLAENIDTLVPAVVQIVMDLAMMLTDPATLVALVDAAIAILMGLSDGILMSLPILLEMIPQIVDNIVATIVVAAPKLVTAALEIILNLAAGLMMNLPQIHMVCIQIMAAIVTAILSMVDSVRVAGQNIGENIKNSIGEFIPMALTWGKDLISNFVSGIKNGIGRVISAAQSIAQAVKDNIGFSEPKDGPLSNFHTYAPDMIDLFTEGIDQNAYKIHDQFVKSLSGLNVAANLTGAQMGKSVGASASPIALNVSVNVGSIANDYDVGRMADTMVEQISQGLEHLKMRQTAAAGGVS